MYCIHVCLCTSIVCTERAFTGEDIRPAQYTTSDSVANGAHELVPESHHSIVTPAIVLPHIPISLTVIATETLNGRNNYAAIMLLYLAFRFCHHSSLRHSESSSSKCGNPSHSSSKDLFHSLIYSSGQLCYALLFKITLSMVTAEKCYTYSYRAVV